VSLRHLIADARFALRLLRRSPGFTATLFVLLVGSIGATTAMFSVVESLLLAPLPYDHPEELVTLWATPVRSGAEPVYVSLPDFLDWEAQSRSFDGMAAMQEQSVTLTAPGAKPERLTGAVVTGDFFDLFRLRALRGRLLAREDDRSGGPRVTVISAALWHDRFTSDPGLVGRALRLDGQDFTVVGVAPEGFAYGVTGSGTVDVWVPLAVHSSRTYSDYLAHRGMRFMASIGRRRAGVSLSAAQAEMSVIAARLAAAYPDSNTLLDVGVRDLHDELVKTSRGGVLVLFAAIGLVFFVVCANVSSLLLARGAARRAEMAMRTALGATRGRLVAQLLTETLVVFLASALAGLVLARWMIRWLLSLLSLGESLESLGGKMDGVVFAACLVASLVFGLGSGLLPALLSSRVEPDVALKQSAARAGASRSHHRVRGALVVTQVALAFALLVGAGLAVRAFAALNGTDPGFSVTDRVTAKLSLPASRYSDDAATRAFIHKLIDAAETQPGVVAAGVNVTLPFEDILLGPFAIEGRPPFPEGDRPELARNMVTPHYFRAMGMPLLRGRTFDESDRTNGRPVVVVSRSMAERFFPDEDAIGKRISLGDSDDGSEQWREIIGVVGNVRHRDLSAPPQDEVFELVDQVSGVTEFSLVVHSRRGNELAHELAALVQGIDSDQAISRARPLRDLVAASFRRQRSTTILLAFFAGAALLLATLGIFGLVSYSTVQRTRELGIRMALGSTPGAVVMLVMRSGLSLLGLGLTLGLVAALLVGGLLRSRLADVPSFDLTVYATVPLLLLTAGAVACLIPALRAVRIPPATALRYE
jgi:putative ABC transport system permease protein